MKNKLLMALTSSLVALVVYWIIMSLINDAVDYIQLAIFFFTFLISFYLASKFLSKPK